MKKKLPYKVECQLCGKKFKTITHSHLASCHDGMTLWQYKKLYPKDPIVSKTSIRKMKKSATHRHAVKPLTKIERKKISRKMKQHWKECKGGGL